MSLRVRNSAFLLSTLTVVACSGDRSEGIAPSRRTGGPKVMWDLERRPLPEVPLPNDAATRLDPTSPTGRRVNVSQQATTRFESDLRRRFDELDGFGVFSPISVSFDAPIDPMALKARHDDDDFRNDAVYLLNVDPSCERYGEEIALDVGRGRFPVLLEKHASKARRATQPGDDGNRLFELDPHGFANNMLFEERNEDVNGNGLLDPGEDLDDDGRLDVANLDNPYACDGLGDDTLERDRCIADHLLTFWERESNTLIVRPVWPLEQRCTHAVVLTHRLVDAAGRAIESPMAGVNPRDQTQALAPITGFLPRYGLSVSDVAFAWTFTTGSMTQTLETIRKGFYGHGPLARLSTEFPADLSVVAPDGLSLPGTKTFPGDCTGMGVSLYWQQGIGEPDGNMCAFAAENTTLAGMVYGTFDVPYFVVDKTGHATPHYPHDAGETFDLDARTGEATYGRQKVTFMCTFPKALGVGCTAGNPDGKPFCAPFPTTVYSHGYGSTRAEVTSYLGRQAELGMAACALDSPGHGGNAIVDSDDPKLLIAKGLLGSYKMKNFGDALFRGRDRDLNNDGQPDSGGDIYSANLFHTRDMLTQAALEFMQFVRILRAMNGTRRSSDGSVLGDFDGDGQPDIGGSAPIGLWGISMGGLITGVLGGAEPAADATVPISGGAGLTDATLRSTVGGLPTMVFLPVVGPFIAGYGWDEKGAPLPQGEVALAFLAGDVQQKVRLDFGNVSGLVEGDQVELRNVDKGTASRVTVRRYPIDIDDQKPNPPRQVASLGFRVAVGADALDAWEKRPIVLGPGNDEPIDTPITFADTPRLGDRLSVRFFASDGSPKQVTATSTGETLSEVSAFLMDTVHQGVLMPKGAPLIALQKGLGYQRNTAQFRRFMGIAQNIVDPVDAAVWSNYYFEQRLDFSYDPEAKPGRNHVLVVPTAGDMVVPVNTGIATARTAGILGSWRRDESVAPEYGWRKLFVPDARYGMSMDRWLVESRVIENIHRLRRFEGKSRCGTAFFDIDDLGEGRSQYKCGGGDLNGGTLDCEDGAGGMFDPPRPPQGNGMRATHTRADGTFDGLRIPYLYPHGQHGIWNAQYERTWDADAHAVNWVSVFLGTGGKIIDLPPECDCSAVALPTFEIDGKQVWYAEENAPCDNTKTQTVRLCSPDCAARLGMKTATTAVCK